MLWSPDAFALRQLGNYLKLIVNNTGASSTHTIYRLRVKSGGNANIVAFSFLNSLTLAIYEVMGIGHGGFLAFDASK